jgi:hypothetical protein
MVDSHINRLQRAVIFMQAQQSSFCSTTRTHKFAHYNVGEDLENIVALGFYFQNLNLELMVRLHAGLVTSLSQPEAATDRMSSCMERWMGGTLAKLPKMWAIEALEASGTLKMAN